MTTAIKHNLAAIAESAKEVAWFSGTQNAAAAWEKGLQFGRRRYAETWKDLGFQDQPEPT